MCQLLLLAGLFCGQLNAKTPPDLIAEALLPRSGATITGQPMSLVGVLGSAALDRSRESAAIHGYWRLAEAVGHYGASLDLTRQLEQLAPRRDDVLLVQTAQASAVAALRDAELTVIASQHELLIQAAMPPGVPLPLPGDKPHVGSYRTNYQQLQVAQRLSARAGLIDQLLPLRRRAIDLRASAVSAAEEAAQAALAAYRGVQGDCPSVLARLAETRRQRLMFMTLVRQYNDDIADYALEIAAPSIRGPALVGMLIETSPNPVRPAGYVEPPPASGDAFGIPRPVELPAIVSPVPGQTPAASPTVPAGAVIGASATLPAAPSGQPVPVIRPGQPLPTTGTESPKDSSPAEPAPLPPTGPPTPTFRPAEPPAAVIPPASSGATPSSKAEQELKVVPVRPSATTSGPTGDGPVPRKVHRPDTDHRSSSPSAGAYQALVGLAPGQQARQLAALLNSRRAAAEGLGRPLALTECLRAVPAARWRTVLDYYWRAGEQAARYQVVGQRAEWLIALAESPGTPLEPAPAACLRSSRLAAEAEQFEVQTELLEAEFQLAAVLDWRQPPWPLPVTGVHCGPCPLELKPWDMRHPEWWLGAELVALVPKLDQSIGEHAAATVAADRLRADLEGGFRGGRVPVERLIAAVHRQTDETLGLARALSDYNRAIGQYAAAVVPPQTPGDRLAALLVPDAGANN